MSTTFDGLQLRHQHGILQCLTFSLSLRNTGTTTMPKNRLHQECEENCGNLSLLHNRNVHHSVEELNLRHEELEELLEFVAEKHMDVQNEEEEP